MPKFLQTSEIYRLLQRELPEDVYPDGPASAYYSTADMGSIADVACTGYGNLERIYVNNYPASADEQITNWFDTVFGGTETPLATLAQQRLQILTKLRTKRGITKPDMIAVVKYVLGASVVFEIIERSQTTGGWRIGVSRLGINTFLNGFRMVDAVGPLLCEQDPSAFGLTLAQWLGMKQQAYTYEVRIYGQTITADQRTRLDAALTREEPARSGHAITDGLDPSTMIGS